MAAPLRALRNASVQRRLLRPRLYSSQQACDVVLVGCGAPNRSMGWYHATQLLEMPNTRLTDVVEPWYLGAGAGSSGSDDFAAFRVHLEQQHGVAFHQSV